MRNHIRLLASNVPLLCRFSAFILGVFHKFKCRLRAGHWKVPSGVRPGTKAI